MNHAVFFYTGAQKLLTMSLHKLFFSGSFMGKGRLRSSAGSEPQGINPSCSLQDSGSFLCLSRKCKKSDFWAFHLPAHRTADFVSSICLVGCFTNCWSILLSCLLFVFLTLILTQTWRRIAIHTLSIDSKLLSRLYPSKVGRHFFPPPLLISCQSLRDCLSAKICFIHRRKQRTQS